MISLGCVRTPTVPVSSVPLPVPMLSLEKTFGEIHFLDTVAPLQITYKNISLIVNPVLSVSSPLIKADYVLFTTEQASWAEAAFLASLDQEQKIIIPTASISSLNKKDFHHVKGLHNGQKILLKKEGSFLFVTAVQVQDPSTRKMVNGYCLEFDNGRNIFISAGISDMTVLRPFLYDLRDDGKQIYIALISGDAASYVDVVSLLQPEAAIFQADPLSKTKIDLMALKQPLADAFFQGQIAVATANLSVPF